MVERTSTTTNELSDAEPLPPNAFARAVRERDLSAVEHLFAEDVELHNPIHPDPIVGRDQVAPLFVVLSEIFEDIEIVEELVAGDRFVFSFETRVGGEPLQIVDLLSFDQAGRITKVVVTARPLAGLEAFADVIAPQRDRFRD
jgi:hypothetical protein